MELCGLVKDGVECLEAVRELKPDVLLLDLEMPRMHGLEVLERLRVECPSLPTVLCSAYTEHGARATLEALARGAADYVTKPTKQANAAAALKALANDLLPKIVALEGWMFRPRKNNRDQHPAAADRLPSRQTRVDAVTIGVSTGGPSALEQMLPRLARSFPAPILIVQHMPKLFTGALAERLDRLCALRVCEARDGETLKPGTITFAPGDTHLEVATAAFGGMAVTRLRDFAPVNHYRPSVDVLFTSAAHVYGAGPAGAGDDGHGIGWAGRLTGRS